MLSFNDLGRVLFQDIDEFLIAILKNQTVKKKLVPFLIYVVLPHAFKTRAM